MEVVNHEEPDFKCDLSVSRSCENPSCRRVAEHASRLVHVATILKTYLVQQNQSALNSQANFNAAEEALMRDRYDYAALQRQVEAGLSYQREVQQLRKELEFHRETIENYKQLLKDGNSLREELRNELTQARKSASIARANLEQEKQNHVRPVILNSSDNRWLETYKEENTKLRESVRILTNKEMELTSVIDRVKDYIGGEVSRIVKSNHRRSRTTFSGAWFIGLLGLLGLSCPPNLRHHLLSRSPSPRSPRRPAKRHQNKDVNSNLTPKKHSSALASVLNELDEDCTSAVVETPEKKTTRKHRKRADSSLSESSDATALTSASKAKRLKRCRKDSQPPSASNNDVHDCDSLHPPRKSRNLPEIGVCFSLSEQNKTRPMGENHIPLQTTDDLMSDKTTSTEPANFSCSPKSALKNGCSSPQATTVDLDALEVSPLVENHFFNESESSLTVLRPSPPVVPLAKDLPKENLLENSVSPADDIRDATSLREKRNNKPKESAKKCCRPAQLLSASDISSIDRVPTRPSVVAKRQKKSISIPSSLRDIITKKFSKSISDWLDYLVSYEISPKTVPANYLPTVNETKVPQWAPSPLPEKRLIDTSKSVATKSQPVVVGTQVLQSVSSPPAEKIVEEVPKTVPTKTQPQVVETNFVQPASSPPIGKRVEDTPRKSSIPIGSCIGMESGIVSTPQLHSLLERLIAYFAGQRELQPYPTTLSMDVVGEAITKALDLLPVSGPSLSLSPPEPVIRCANLLKARIKPSEMSSFTSWFRTRPNAKGKRRCLPKSPLMLYRLAQVIFLTCEPSHHSDILYQLTTFLLFNGYNKAPISCLLLAFQPKPPIQESRLDSVYRFLAWKEAEESTGGDLEDFVSGLRVTSTWNSISGFTSLLDLVSKLVDDFCYRKEGDDFKNIAKALRLILISHAFANLDVKKASTCRFGLVGWLLKARLLNWISSLSKSDDDSALSLMLRVASLSVDVILLSTQLDLRHILPKKSLSPCQRGLLNCSNRLFDVLSSTLTKCKQQQQHTPLIIFCLLRMSPTLSEDQIKRLRALLLDIPTDTLPNQYSLGISSILPPLQNAFITRCLERLEIASNHGLVQCLKAILTFSDV